MSQELQVYDLTTKSGLQKTGEALKSLGSAIVTTGAVGFGIWLGAGLSVFVAPVATIPMAIAGGAIALFGRKAFKPRVSIEKQVEAARQVIHAGKMLGVRRLQFRVSSKAGLQLGSTFDGVPLKQVSAASDEMVIEVEYFDR